jgi:chromosome segregation ATPase
MQKLSSRTFHLTIFTLLLSSLSLFMLFGVCFLVPLGPLRSFRERNGAFESELTARRQKMVVLEASVEELKAELLKTEDALQSFRDQLQKFSSASSTVEAKCGELQQEIADLELMKASCVDDLQKMQLQMNESHADVEHVKARHHEALLDLEQKVLESEATLQVAEANHAEALQRFQETFQETLQDSEARHMAALRSAEEAHADVQNTVRELKESVGAQAEQLTVLHHQHSVLEHEKSVLAVEAMRLTAAHDAWHATTQNCLDDNKRMETQVVQCEARVLELATLHDALQKEKEKDSAQGLLQLDERNQMVRCLRSYR